MTLYPILVERFGWRQSLTIVCEKCHAEGVIDAEEITSEDIYECPADTVRRQRTWPPEPMARCGGMACMKYEQADKCRGCGKLGFWEGPSSLEGCCSRRCMLQAEYATSLGGAVNEEPFPCAPATELPEPRSNVRGQAFEGDVLP